MKLRGSAGCSTTSWDKSHWKLTVWNYWERELNKYKINHSWKKERSQPLQPDLARLSRIFWQRTSVQLSIFVAYQRIFIRRVLRDTGRLAYLVKLENTMIFRIVRKFRWNQQRFFRGIHFDFRFFAVQVATINRSTIMSPLYVWSAVSVWRP